MSVLGILLAGVLLGLITIPWATPHPSNKFRQNPFVNFLDMLHTERVQGQFCGGPGGPRPPVKNVALHWPPFWPSLPRLSLIWTSNILNSAAKYSNILNSAAYCGPRPPPQLELWPPIGPHLACTRTARDRHTDCDENITASGAEVMKNK